MNDTVSPDAAEVPAVDVAVPEITQVGFVVEDLESAMRRFGRLFGVGPWLEYRYEPPRLTETTYRGEAHDYSMRVALTDVEGPVDLATDVVSAGALARFVGLLASIRESLVGLWKRLGLPAGEGDATPGPLPNPGMPGVNVELIEPLEGPSIYTDHLDEQGPGLHHVGCFAFDDPREVVEQYREAGVPVVQSGNFEGLEFWYLEADEIADGLLFETAANLTAVPEPDAVFSTEDRAGGPAQT